MIKYSRCFAFAAMVILFSGCTSGVNAAGAGRNRSLTNIVNNMSGHINGHSITLYNEAVQLQRMGDRNAAIRDFRQSANLGNIKAMLQMGIIYASGHGVLINRTMAKYWISKAYNQAAAMHDYTDREIASHIWKRFQLWKY